MPQKLLRLYGRNVLGHVLGLLGTFAPYLVQLGTNRIGWTVATAASSGVLATWLGAHAHISGKLAGSIAGDLGALGGKMTQPGAAQSILAELEPLLGSFFGGHAGGAATAPMAPPAGMEGLVPPGTIVGPTGTGTMSAHTPEAGTV